MRAAFFLLLFANLAFLAWAEWIDAPQPAPTNEAYARLPRLKLINEVPPEESRPSSSNARRTALEVPPPPAAATEAQRRESREAPEARRGTSCVSVGPFDSETSANRGTSQLRDKGFTPRQRTEPGEVSKGFWVYVGGLKTDGDVARVMRTLQQSHIDDAHLMPDTGDSHQVSVGLFSDRDRADHRAQSVQKLGLQPEVAERKLPTTVFWMDIDVPAGTPTPTSQDLAADSHASVISCPGSAAPTAPVPAVPEDGSTPFRTKVATGASGASKVP